MTAKLLIAGFVLFGTVALLVALGAVDFVPRDGAVDRPTAVRSLFTYWILWSSGILVGMNLRRQWKRFLLLAASTALALGVAELGLRYFLLEQALPRFGGIASRQYHHVYPPNAMMYGRTVEGQVVTVQTNQDGLRTQLSRAEFRRHGERIVILGDSFTFGVDVPQDSVFPDVTQRLLRAALNREDIAVLNAGLVGYSPFLSRLLFRGIVRHYDPTLVVLFLDASDIGDDIHFNEEAVGDEGRVSFHLTGRQHVTYHGALYNLLSPLIERHVTPYLTYPYDALTMRVRQEASHDFYRFQIAIDDVIERNRFFIYRHPLEKTRPYFLKTLGYVDDIADMAGQSGARFMLVVTPRFQHWNTKECPDNWEADQYSLNEPFQYEYFRFFEEIREQTPYEILNLLPAFRETEEFPLVFRDDPHWNQRGHAFVAGALANHLLEHEVAK